MRINLLAAGLMALLIGPAVAAEEFFVVQNPETKNCKISNSKDDGQHLYNWNVGVGRFSAKNDARK
ncbi:MAG: hypothetical protein WA717_08895 [Methyloceanibacter sp.]